MQLKLAHLENRRKSKGKRSKPNGQVDEHAAQQLGVGLSTVRRKYAMLNKLLREHGIDGLKTLSVENRRGKATRLPTRVPTTKRVLRQVRAHVRMQRERRTPHHGRTGADFLRKHRHVDVRPSFAGDGDDELDRALGRRLLRAVQRFSSAAGASSQAHAEEVPVAEENLPQQPQKQPSTRKCGRCKQPGHTRKKCPVADEDLPEQPQQQQGRPRKPSRGSFHTGDYHKAFNSDNFISWFKDALLPNLHQPSLIIMDNAAYHRTLPPDTPVPGRMKKADVIAALRARNLTVSEIDFSCELKDRLKLWVKNHVQPEVVQLAEAQGHKVLFSPPCYSDLNPIELVWALIKGNVGRRYSLDTTFEDVERRLEEEIQRLAEDRGQYRKDGKTRVQAIIDSIDKQLERQRRIIDGRGEEEAVEQAAPCTTTRAASADSTEEMDVEQAAAVVLDEEVDWVDERMDEGEDGEEGEECEEGDDDGVSESDLEAGEQSDALFTSTFAGVMPWLQAVFDREMNTALSRCRQPTDSIERGRGTSVS
ncbi:hypothetical protein PTSG_11539 [Salpingoeca rosetta]|uniref:CCHC-type domain-containing protein n=1 Tax=Salpingoeca rosetta (strain ATCC 50818 / BSB-021) TaxID=946362 RepID=F2TVH4_SALR5|nr:uncharacterized protein PTSG_11539 [Salpingoeca rosetta]EGD72070.1 hypothetical protein PTSG_11539 [Salpingoeca rosetta]|eukprot:XP_004998642.1 hypothetical protein PTSG_11539 [Salpingoeca rosetta]